MTSPSFCATSRAIASVPAPGAKGTTIRTARSGYTAEGVDGPCASAAGIQRFAVAAADSISAWRRRRTAFESTCMVRRKELRMRGLSPRPMTAA